MSDELHQMAWGGDLVLTYRPRSEMTKALEIESALKSPTSTPVRKGSNFFQECLAPLPSVKRGDEITPGLSKISDEPGCENEENSKQYWRKNIPGPWHSMRLPRKHTMIFKGNH